MRALRGIDPVTGQAWDFALAGGRILSAQAIAPAPDMPYVTGGLVDLQVNGWGGHDFNAEGVTPDTVLAIAAGLRAQGIRAFLPTLITGARDRLIQTLRVLNDTRAAHPWLVAMIPAVHMEGPFISPEDGARGAHPVAHVRAPDLDELAAWQEASNGLVKLVTLCPAWDNAPDFIRAAVGQGVQVSLGHSHATPEQVHAAVAAGAGFSTHLGNGLAAMLPRHPNLLWAQLASPMAAMFIADGHHLDRDVLTAMLRAKGPKKSILVSDMVALSGLPPGRYAQPIGGDVTLSAEGRLSVTGTPYLAGAVKSLSEGVAHVARLDGFDLGTALAMASTAPARVLGLGDPFAKGAPPPLTFSFADGDDRLHFHHTGALARHDLPIRPDEDRP